MQDRFAARNKKLEVLHQKPAKKEPFLAKARKVSMFPLSPFIFFKALKGRNIIAGYVSARVKLEHEYSFWRHFAPK
jgi:hypothetical protein